MCGRWGGGGGGGLFFFQAEDGIRDLVRSRGLGDVYKRQALHHNPGAMLGLFSDLPPVLRIVSLSTGGAFLVVIYALIQYLLPIKSLILRSGMSVLLLSLIHI